MERKKDVKSEIKKLMETQKRRAKACM